MYVRVRTAYMCRTVTARAYPTNLLAYRKTQSACELTLGSPGPLGDDRIGLQCMSKIRMRERRQCMIQAPAPDVNERSETAPAGSPSEAAVRQGHPRISLDKMFKLRVDEATRHIIRG